MATLYFRMEIFVRVAVTHTTFAIPPLGGL